MTRAWLLLLVACNQSGGDDEFPVNPGTGPGTGKIPDAAPIDAADLDASNMIAGRVCLVTDLRNLTACANTGAGNITVTLGTRMTTTAVDGKFTIATPTGSNLVWRATGVDIVKSVMPFGTSNSIPAIGVEDYNDLTLANSVVEQAGQGSIIARIVKGTTPQTGATAAASPLAQFATKYDGPAALTWTELSTSTAGTAWIAGADVGTPTITVTPATGTAASDVVRVEDGAITFVVIDLP